MRTTGPGAWRPSIFLRTGTAAVLTFGVVAVGVACSDGSSTSNSRDTQVVQQQATAGSIATGTAIPGQGTGGGAGSGGGVPQGNATVPGSPTTAASSATSAAVPGYATTGASPAASATVSGSATTGANPTASATASLAPSRGPTSESDRMALISDLSAGFQGHVYLVGMMAEAARDGDTARETATMNVLTNGDTAALAQSMGLLGANIPAFTQLWNGHIQLYKQYMDAKKAGDNGTASDARTKLQDFPSQFVDFAKGFAPAVAAGTTGEDALNQHVNTTLSVIDATLTNQPAAPQQLRDEARTMADFAKLMMGVGVS